jgi:hypothetical protein
MKNARSKKSRDSVPLKVVTNKKQGEVGRVANERYWSRTLVIDALLSIDLATSCNYSISFSAYSS